MTKNKLLIWSSFFPCVVYLSYYLGGGMLHVEWTKPWVPGIPTVVTKVKTLVTSSVSVSLPVALFLNIFCTEPHSIAPGERKPSLLSLFISLCRTGVLTHHYCSFSHFDRSFLFPFPSRDTPPLGICLKPWRRGLICGGRSNLSSAILSGLSSSKLSSLNLENIPHPRHPSRLPASKPHP